MQNLQEIKLESIELQNLEKHTEKKEPLSSRKFEELSEKEQQLCDKLRVHPDIFLNIK